LVHTLRAARGYSFEKSIVDQFNADRWTARRLGGSSTGLPDIVATSSSRQMLFSIEAKSTIGDACYVPNDQLVRCYEILRMFDMYSWRYIVLAFKFAKSKTNKNKKLQYWYFVVEDYYGIHNIKSVKCKRDGQLTINIKDIEYKAYLLTRTYTTLKEIMEMEREAYKPVKVEVYTSERKSLHNKQ